MRTFIATLLLGLAFAIPSVSFADTSTDTTTQSSVSSGENGNNQGCQCENNKGNASSQETKSPQGQDDWTPKMGEEIGM